MNLIYRIEYITASELMRTPRSIVRRASIIYRRHFIYLDKTNT